MKNQEEILKLLEEQVINKTLNLEGIGMVQKIVNENKELKSENDSNEALLKTYRLEIKENGDTIRNLNSDLTDAKQRIVAFEADDKKRYEESIKFMYEQQRAEELKEIVGMALRNPVITQSRNGNVFGSQTDHNGVIKNDTVIETVETETK